MHNLRKFHVNTNRTQDLKHKAKGYREPYTVKDYSWRGSVPPGFSHSSIRVMLLVIRYLQVFLIDRITVITSKKDTQINELYVIEK